LESSYSCKPDILQKIHCDCQTHGSEKEESWTKFTESLGSTTPTSKVWQANKSISGKQGSTNFPISNQHTTSEEIAVLFLDQFTHGCVSAEDRAADEEVYQHTLVHHNALISVSMSSKGVSNHQGTLYQVMT
jgi:hypothetical protein